ncbi:MAG TPA: PD-(D/E)XK nuclease family protein [Candidatus Nanoarchaeia archaeon]|nr:PD-(D/E)XK nuclease family protein [Candidatus Nanoarchaeia archaeon]
METEKGCEKQICFNLSPSSLNIYYQSPLLFYLTYIAKVPDDTQIPVCYGLSGNIVHECLEKYAKQEIDRDEAYAHLLTQWIEKNLHRHQDVFGSPLNQMEYINAMIKGIEIVDKHENHICEEMISFPLKENGKIKIGMKGIIDLQATEKSTNQLIVLDYKTSNSLSESKAFERQALFYNLLIYKKKNIMPAKTSLHYLKLGVCKDYTFTLEDIEDFEKGLHKIADMILMAGTNIKNYPIGKIDGLFNTKKQACLKEIEKRVGQQVLQIPNKPVLEPNLEFEITE